MLIDAFSRALDARAELLPTLHDEGTDIYRLLHGATEGVPGTTVDRYGPLLLVQTWRDPIEPSTLTELQKVAAKAGLDLLPVWNHRASVRGQGRTPDYGLWHDIDLPEEIVGHEFGLTYDVSPRHHGLDPLLFIDFRAARRRVRRIAKGKTVLNLFAYTCGIGLVAAARGAKDVWNVDFAASSLAVGEANTARNPEVPPVQRFLKADALPTMRQLAGLKPGGRRGKRPRIQSFAQRTFDVVVLDPPRWAKSPFGAVDVVRDYASLLKPALLATAKGGHLLATNHVAAMDWDDWVESMKRCAIKAERPMGKIERLWPEADLPSPDGRPPLKLAWIKM